MSDSVLRASLFACHNDTRANVAAIFAILIFPLLVAVAGTIDTARHIAANRQIQLAVDAATLAGARALEDDELSDKQVKAIIEASFNANSTLTEMDLSCAKIEADVERDNDGVDLQVECQMPKIFGNMFGLPATMKVSRNSYSEHASPTLDLALMIDVSGSVNNEGRLAAAKAGAKALISTLITEETGSRVKIALIPYGASINAGIWGNRAQGYADENDNDGDGDRVCVSHRETVSNRFTDDLPTDGHYMTDYDLGFCREPMIVPLTDDADALSKSIDAITANSGATSSHLGIAWSWYAITSKWASIWPEESKPRNNTHARALKAIVVLTDGISNRHHEISGRRAYTLSANDTMAFCNEILDDNVLIYVIGLSVEDPTFGWVDQDWIDAYGPDKVLSTCADDPARLFRPDSSDELVPLYETIAKKLEVEPLRLLK